jgi:hypothetical protein
MRARLLLLGIPCLLNAAAHAAEVKLDDRTTIVFATAEEGRRLLTAKDDFIKRMSPFDRAARLKTDRDVSEDEYLRFVGQQVQEWQAEPQQKFKSVIEGLHERLSALSLPFPKTVYFICTTGDEEGGAAYTRGNAVVLPPTMPMGDAAALERIICHELFHVLSRANPKLKESLYASIGFDECDEVEFPAELKHRKITNPDAPVNDHCIRVSLEQQPVWAIPVLFSKSDKYDVQRGGEFFQYLQFELLIVERVENLPEVKPIYEDGKARLASVRQISGFHEQIGRNTKYIVHPEEILADNFALLFARDGKVPSPEVLKKIREVLAGKASE